MSDAMSQHSRGMESWGIKIGSKASFLVKAIEVGDQTEESIRSEYIRKFNESIGASESKSTFNVYLGDLQSGLGHASMSRAIRVETNSQGHISLNPDRAKVVTSAIAKGILKEFNALPGGWSHQDERAIEAVLDRFGVPLRYCRN